VDVHDRLRWDVRVVAAALIEHLYPWVAANHSHPRVTSGASLGYTLMRTNHLAPKSVIHHNDPDLSQAEMVAAGGGGRREAWRHGDVSEPLEEWDYTMAHPTICLERLPVRATDRAWYDPSNPGRYMYLHRVLVSQDQPLLPVRHDTKGMIYPTGRFDTIVWGDELAYATSQGLEVIEHRGQWAYVAEPVLAPWAEWIMDEVMNPDVDPIVARCMKQWSHTLVGKTGTRWSETREVTDLVQWPTLEVNLFGKGGIAVCNCGYDLFDMWVDRIAYVPDPSGEGGRAWAINDDAGPAATSCPSIMSYVMSQQRIRMWKAMRAAGLENVVTVNTDGLIVTKKGAAKLRKARIPGLRRKARYPSGIIVYGATAWREIAGPSRKVAGLKAGAEEVEPGKFEQIETIQLPGGGVRQARRYFNLTNQPIGRQRAADGHTKAHKIRGR
jgi:hypothetical protein